ncbi:MAG: hypothetical protein SO160_03050 [Lachnospiraceae bacterium]|nr:hypothetical protein [Lachnospiraceae bacterium]
MNYSLRKLKSRYNMIAASKATHGAKCRYRPGFNRVKLYLSFIIIH